MIHKTLGREDFVFITVQLLQPGPLNVLRPIIVIASKEDTDKIDFSQ